MADPHLRGDDTFIIASVSMAQLATDYSANTLNQAPLPNLSGETRNRLGHALREAYVEPCESLPITDAQVELLLRLRQKERDRRRGA